MNAKVFSVAAALLAASTLFLPFMAVGDITTGVLTGVVKKPELTVFLSPALLVGLVAALGATLGFPKRRVVVTIVLGLLNLAVFALMMAKLKDGATAGLALWSMGAVPVLAIAAAILGRSSPRVTAASL